MKKPNQSNFQENVDQMSIKQLVFSILPVALGIQLFKVSMRVHAQSLQLCQTLCNPMDCSSSSSSVNGILQVRILQWVALPFSRGSSRPRDKTQVSGIGRQVLYHWATRQILDIAYLRVIGTFCPKMNNWWPTLLAIYIFKGLSSW